MNKFSFIIPIRNRAHLLSKGLMSLNYMNYDKNRFEIVIIDHMSEDNINEVISVFPTLKIKHIIIDPTKYKYEICLRNGFCNPGLGQNIGVEYSNGEYIILTSPEVIHHSENLKNLDLISNLDRKFIYGKVIEKSLPEIIKDLNFKNIDTIQTNNWDEILCDWVKKGICVSNYFIGVLSRKLFLDIGGIDEVFMNGVAYEDDDFGNRIIAIPGVISEYKSNIFGIHLKHSREYLGSTSLGFNNDLLRNNNYLEYKSSQGWDKNIVANKDRKNSHIDVIVKIKDYV